MLSCFEAMVCASVKSGFYWIPVCLYSYVLVKLGMLKPTYPCCQTLVFTTYLVSSHIAAFVDIIRGEYRFWLDIIDLDSKQLNQKIGLKSKSENIFSAAHCKYLLIIHWWNTTISYSWHSNFWIKRLVTILLMGATALTRCTDYCQIITINTVYQSSFLKEFLIHML